MRNSFFRRNLPVGEMLKYVGVKCLDTLELPCAESKGRWKNQSVQDAKNVSVVATDDNLFVIYTGGLVIQKLVKIPVLENAETESNIKPIFDHKTSITCIGFSEGNSLVCTCSDEAIILRKWNLTKWDCYIIGELMGRILSCTIAVKDQSVYTFVVKQDEILILLAVSTNPLNESGSLDIQELTMFATCKKAKENMNWVNSILVDDKIYLTGLTTGNGVSLKMWEVCTSAASEDNKIKMICQHTAAYTMKSVAAIDFASHYDQFYLLLITAEGHAEIYTVSPSGFALINRFKLEEYMHEMNPSNEHLFNTTQNCSATNLNTSRIELEFRVLSAKFFFRETPRGTSAKQENLNNSNDDGIAPLNNSLSIPSSSETYSWFPKLPFVVATSNKIYCVDGKSGEIQMFVQYEEFVKSNNILVNNAKLAINSEHGEILIAIQPILQKHIFTFRLYVDLVESEEDVREMRICSLVPSEALDSKSVLRKRLKSPPKFRTPSDTGKSCSRTSINYPSWVERNNNNLNTSSRRSTLMPPRRMSMLKRSNSTVGGAKGIDGDSKPYDGPLTSRPTKLRSRGNYDNEELIFSMTALTKLPGNLSDGLASIRMVTTKDGKTLAVGGNKSPLLILKSHPSLETIRSIKDVSFLTALSFSFNDKYLLVATNNCKTVLLDWNTGKEKLHVEFNSKFNEHVHSQFYFMDKFILQPEGKQIALYSYAMNRESGNVKLKAGSFDVKCQSITAMAAANQFLSNIIITGQSNKCLQVFDANAEHVVATISNCHIKPIHCIRLNEAPKGILANELCNLILTSCPSNIDPIKLWDLRIAKCAIRLSDFGAKSYNATSRPSLSPCGRYVISSYEDNTITVYDVRKINSRVNDILGTGSAVLDSVFDVAAPMVWCGCRNGTLWHLNVSS